MRVQDFIEINPDIRFGKPVIKNTRIAVNDILGWLASGMTKEEIVEDYPSLNFEMINAALSFSAQRENYIKIVLV
ncbi:MAG TPA: DUF433 domain-containing protein [Chitinophagaceae bacterium]|jgi:uncharacterized protein (DUF433 family)|nr:DUF433 domain-containing protein [Chitinophagaceae bacterium]